MYTKLGVSFLVGTALFGCSSPSKISTEEADTDINVLVDADGDGYLADEDCNDNDASVYTGASEICDGVDNNCDGEIDEGVMDTFFADNDEDGFGDPNNTIDSCSSPTGYVDTPNDCNDLSAEAFPGNNEICDDLDNNCDGDIDEGIGEEYYLDADGDGYGLLDSPFFACEFPVGYATEVGDCDDSNKLVYPNAYEICDGLDNDCDGDIDNDALDADLFYLDFDEDGFGDPDTPVYACAQPSGAVTNQNDCNDVDTAIHPNATEICDTQDNNCNGLTDEEGAIDALSWYADADGDGYGTTSSVLSCTQPIGFSAVSGDCNDANSAAHPARTEACDDIDNNCDGIIDEGVRDTWFLDYDGDGYGNASFSLEACVQPNNYVSDSSDCNDLSAQSYLGASEICDGIDNDCDGNIDNDAPGLMTLFEDNDLDGYGSTTSIQSCTLLLGYSDESGDCDDDDEETSPEGLEICDGQDNDCDGVTDNEVLGSGALCAAETCLEILDYDANQGSGMYWLNWNGAVAQHSCDMVTDGGGWTALIEWDRENNGDSWSDLYDNTVGQMKSVYNNMTEQNTNGNALIWSDWDGTGDVMILEKDVPFTNQGQVLLDINYYGYSLENSALYFFGETATGFENMLCRDDNFGSGYNTIEMSYVPYDCADSSNASWTWNDIYLNSLSDSISTLHFRSLHYDGGGGDRSYLYHLNMWVR